MRASRFTVGWHTYRLRLGLIFQLFKNKTGRHINIKTFYAPTAVVYFNKTETNGAHNIGTIE